MTEPIDLDALIAEARKLPGQFRAAQLPDSAYDEDSALAELDAVGYLAVYTSKKLADALESAQTELRQEREWADDLYAANAGLVDAVYATGAALSRAEDTIEAVEDFVTRHYLDTQMGEKVLAILAEHGPEPLEGT